MIRFNAALLNWRKPCEFKSLYQRAWVVSANRTLELQLYRYDYELLSFSVDLHWKGESHAGPEIELNLLGWNFRIGLPNNRH